MNIQSTRSFALAAAAAALLVAGCAQAGSDKVAEAKIHCGGINACKGQTDCKSAENSCKGQNVCKAHGFKAVSKTDCDAKGGHEVL